MHYWVNNAALNGGRRPFLDVPDDAIEAVVKVNMFGARARALVASSAGAGARPRPPGARRAPTSDGARRRPYNHSVR